VFFFTGGGSWVFEFPTAFLAAEPPPTQFSFNDQRDASPSVPSVVKTPAIGISDHQRPLAVNSDACKALGAQAYQLMAKPMGETPMPRYEPTSGRDAQGAQPHPRWHGRPTRGLDVMRKNEKTFERNKLFLTESKPQAPWTR
jgi:hypothetical protein